MKRLAVLAMIAMMAMPVQAATYSDRFISFEYDDTTPSIMYCFGYRDTGFMMEISTAEHTDEESKTASIEITIKGKTDMPMTDDAEIVSDDPLTAKWSYTDNKDITHYALRKQIAKSGDRIAYVTLWSTDNEKGYDFCKQIYDSVQADLSAPNECRYMLLHSSLPYSDEIIPYIEQSIKLIDQALDGGDADALAKDAESLIDSVKAVSERSGMEFDFMVTLFMPDHYDFDSSGDLLDAKLTAQEVLDILTE